MNIATMRTVAFALFKMKRVYSISLSILCLLGFVFLVIALFWISIVAAVNLTRQN